MALDIEERHLLRLGHGEEALETEKDFSRFVKIDKPPGVENGLLGVAFNYP